MTLTLNAEQQALADSFFEFLLDPNEDELIITGPGGTGKTHLMRYLVNNVIPLYETACQLYGVPVKYTGVVMTATTNTAAEVLGSLIGMQTETIHTFMNLRLQDDYESGNSKLVRTPAWHVHNNLIIFIDESPYIDSYLLRHIKEGTANCKLVYVGDHKQNTPVKEKISPIYTKGLNYYELTIPMRTGDPHLQALNDKLRANVDPPQLGEITLVPGVIDWIDYPDIAQELQVFSTPTVDKRVLTYTNAQALMFANYTRSLRTTTEKYIVGECLVNNHSIVYSKGRTLPTEAKVTVLATGNEYITTTAFGDSIDVYDVTVVPSFDSTQITLRCPIDKDNFTSLLKQAKRNKEWRRYFDLKNNFPDFRTTDSSTIHKAQGSSIDTVYIDLTDLNSCTNRSLIARLLYVAASRAKKRVVFFGDLNDIPVSFV